MGRVGPVTTDARSIEIRLRPWRPEEADWYLAALDAEILRWTRESAEMDAAECAAALGSPAAGSPRSFAIVTAERDEPIGNLGVTRQGGEVELSYWVAAEFRGRGVATAALRAGTDRALADPGVASCFLLIHPANAASIRVAERAGLGTELDRRGS